MRSYAPADITAINISEAQLAAAGKRAPGCTFLRMDATRLAFPDEHFDAVMCVEAAFHFNTRGTFFREALRVLKPGGSLVLTDMLFRAFMKPIGDFGQVPRANFVPDIASYRTEFEADRLRKRRRFRRDTGLLAGVREHLGRWPLSEHRSGRMGLAKTIAASAISRGIAQYFRIVCKTYLIASARKPMPSPVPAQPV